jgi:hypothetical protein
VIAGIYRFLKNMEIHIYSLRVGGNHHPRLPINGGSIIIIIIIISDAGGIKAVSSLLMLSNNIQQ